LIPVTAMVVAGNGASAASSASVVADNTPVVRVALDADRNPVGPGEALSYTLTYANPASVSAPNAVLRALVPLNTTFQSASDGGAVNSNNWVEWSLGTVGAGQNGQRYFTVHVNSGLASGTELLAQAEIFDSASPQDAARAEAATVVSDAAPLSLQLVASPDPVRPGEQVNLEMTVVNHGGTDLAGVKVWLATPSYVQWYENSDALPLPDGAAYAYVNPGDAEVWTLGTLSAGQSRTVVVAAEVYSGSSAPADGTLIPVTAMVVAGNGASAAASASVVADNTPVVRVTLDADRNPVGPGESLSYTLTYANPANVSAPNAVLRALVPLNTTFQSASDGGAVNSNNWVEWSLGTVGAGQNGQRYFTVHVNSGLASGTELLAQAEIFDSASPQDAARAEAATVVSDAAPLSLQLVASPDPVRPGEQVNLEMTVVNHGGTDLAGVKVWLATPSYVQWYENSDALPLPDGAAYAYVNPGDAEVWTLGTLSAGQSRTVVVAAEVYSGSSAPADGTLIPVTAMVVAGNGASAAASASVVADNGTGGCSFSDTYPYRTASIFNPGNPSDPSTIDPWAFYNRECTSYAAWKLNQAASTTTSPYFFSNYMSGGHFGDARGWATNAAAIGFAVNHVPAVGAIAQWNAGEPGGGASGHVAYVEALNPDGTVAVSEYNYHLDHTFDVRCSVTPPRFLHIHDVSTPPAPSITPCVSGGALQTVVSGLSFGEHIVLEVSPDLKTWTAMQTNTVNTSTFTLTNTINPAMTGQFFRVRAQ
jgi:uncharacterized repeat protein (TIGR01451 family)